MIERQEDYALSSAKRGYGLKGRGWGRCGAGVEVANGPTRAQLRGTALGASSPVKGLFTRRPVIVYVEMPEMTGNNVVPMPGLCGITSSLPEGEEGEHVKVD